MSRAPAPCPGFGIISSARDPPEPMAEAMNWLRRYERFWSASLDRLSAYAEAEEAKAGGAKTRENTT
jgi:hypothetical protein